MAVKLTEKEIEENASIIKSFYGYGYGVDPDEVLGHTLEALINGDDFMSKIRLD